MNLLNLSKILDVKKLIIKDDEVKEYMFIVSKLYKIKQRKTTVMQCITIKKVTKAVVFRFYPSQLTPNQTSYSKISSI